MLMFSNIFQPFEQDVVMAHEEFARYIRIAESQIATSPFMMKHIKNTFYGQHEYSTPKEDLDRIWNLVAPALERNAGLAKFTNDYEGALSEYFFPWLIMLVTSQSEALMLAYGLCRNLRGEVRVVQDDDPIMLFVKNDPTFVAARERAIRIANLATLARLVMPEGVKSKVIDLGAGRMPWARFHGFEFDPEKQKILAFDKDTSIVPKELLGVTASEEYFKFRHEDIFTAISRNECSNANLVILSGVASYLEMPVLKEQIVKPLHSLLRPGGLFFFDVQLDCIYYKRSMKIFSWPKLRLDDTANEIDKMVDELEQEGFGFNLETETIKYDGTPINLFVKLTKK